MTVTFPGLRPYQLTDFHLRREYNFLSKIGRRMDLLVKKHGSIEKIKIPERLPPHHFQNRFFFNKGRWVEIRFTEILMEIRNRNMKCRIPKHNPAWHWIDHPHYYNDWQPDQAMRRISTDALISECLREYFVPFYYGEEISQLDFINVILNIKPINFKTYVNHQKPIRPDHNQLHKGAHLRTAGNPENQLQLHS